MAWSAPTTSVLDDFNRAGPSLGSNWSLLQGASVGQITSNTAQVNASGQYSEYWWNPTSFTGEAEVYLTVPTVDTTTGHQIYLDIFTGWSTSSTSALNGYQLTFSRAATNDTFQIDRYTAGSIAGGNIKPATAMSGHLAAGDSIALTREAGGVLKMWRKPAAGSWTQIGTSVTDTTYFNAGQSWSIGWGAFGSTYRLDDFGGGTITSGAVSLSRTSGDTVTVTDAAARARATARTTSDSSSVTDAATRLLAVARTASESVTASDAAVQSRGTTRTAADSLTATDAATRAWGSARTSSDSTAVSDSSTRTASLPRSATDSSTVSDTAARTSSRSRSATETITVGDAGVRAVQGYVRTSSETVTGSDVAVVSGSTSSFTRTSTDAVAFSDLATRAAYARTRTATDTTTVADAAVRLTARSRTGTEPPWTISDTATKGPVGRPRSTTDSLAVSDTVTRNATTWLRVAADGLVVTDTATGTVSGLVTAVGALEGSLAGVFSEGLATTTARVETSMSSAMAEAATTSAIAE